MNGSILVRSTSGKFYSWGHNHYGQLGINSTSHMVDTPTELKALANLPIVQIACTAFHMLALTSEGEVYAWGHNLYGELGIGTNKKQIKPCKIPQEYFKGEKVTCVGSGSCQSSFCCTENGNVFAWGQNSWAQLGIGFKNYFATLKPTLVEFQPPQFIKKIVCGSQATALSQNGEWFVWYRTYTTVPKPTLVQTEKDDPVEDIFAVGSSGPVLCKIGNKIFTYKYNFNGGPSLEETDYETFNDFVIQHRSKAYTLKFN